MRSHLSGLSVVLLLCSFCGCRSSSGSNATAPLQPSVVAGNGNFDLPTRNNALALLYDLLNDEKNLSKILIIKRHSDKLGRLVKNISQAASDGAKMLDSLAKNDPGINLKAVDLPPGEMATRKAISKTKEYGLLHSKDAEFEFQLLLTQVEALGYGADLAMVVARNEGRPERVRDFLRLSAQLRDLNEQVLARLRKK